MKRISQILLASVMALSITAGLGTNQQVHAAPPVQIKLDDYPLAFPVEPIIINGTTMVPFRAISEALGISVNWNQSTKTISAVKGTGANSVHVKLTLNNNTATVNSSNIQLPMAPKSVNGNTLIPLSFFSQQFGATVNWNSSTRTVSIDSPQKRLYTLGFYALSSYSDVDKVPSFDAISFGWSRIDENGNFTLSGKDFKVPQPAGEVTAESLIQSASSSRATPYLMVYSGDTKGELTKVIEDSALRDQVISDMIDAANDYSFEGIMLDLEGLGLTTDKTTTRTSFNLFIKEVTKKTRAAGLKLSLALHPLNSSFQGYDYTTLGQLADEIVIMAYDYQVRTSGSKAKPEPTDKVNEAIRLALQETSKDKLVLGLNLNSEDASSIKTLVGLAKRYDLKGIALWRLGLTQDNEWDTLRRTVEFKK